MQLTKSNRCRALHEAVMNYLVVEGHSDVARELQKEAEIDRVLNIRVRRMEIVDH
jgi:hypothetical protein